MPNVKNDGNIAFTDNEREAITGILSSASRHIAHIKQMISDDALAKLDMETYLDSMRYHIEDAAKAAGLDDYIKNKLKDAEENLRTANLKIRELESLVGNEVHPKAVSAGLRKYDDILRAWYRLSGFRYASVDYYYQGVRASFTPEIERENERLGEGVTAIMNELKDEIPYEFGPGRYEMFDERYHYTMLDTDGNKDRLKTLFATVFPNSRVQRFESMRDCDNFTLRTEVYIPYQDLEDIYSPRTIKPDIK